MAACPADLEQSASDLARVVEAFGHVDVLLAAEDVAERADDEQDEVDQAGAAAFDEVRGSAAVPGLPGAHLHRLGLAAPLRPGAEADVIAALSELVGFDPEPGVYCVAPTAVDVARAVADRAARRIAQVYGIPLLHYRCLELPVSGGLAS